MSLEKDTTKTIAVEFFQWWWNQPLGKNTEEGFETWWEQNGNRFPALECDWAGCPSLEVSCVPAEED